MFDENFFQTSDGISLPLRYWPPQGGGSPAAVVLALHGFNDYSNAFADPALFLGEHAIATYAIDQRGFGESPHRGLWAGGDVMARDAAEMAALLRARYPLTPLYILGESMGGAVAILALSRRLISAGEKGVDGVILVAPAVWGRPTMNFFQVGALWLGAHSVPWMELTGQGLEIQASDNIEMLRALSQDPLVIRETRVDTIYGLVDLMDMALAGAEHVRVPALVLYGQRDEVIPLEPIANMLESWEEKGTPPPITAFYEDGYHMLTRDLAAEVVMGDIAAFIASPSEPLPSQADVRAGERLKASVD